MAEHAAEAAFLWAQRDRAVGDLAYDLDALSRIDERLEAHVDALRLAGEVGREVAEAAADDAGSAFVAATLAVGDGDAASVVSGLDAAERSPMAFRAVFSACGWARERDARAVWLPLLDGPDETLRLIALAALSAHRVDPGERLLPALHDPAPRVRARALRLVGELARPDLIGAVTLALADDDDACRFHAAAAGALLGVAGAAPTLYEFASQPGAFALRAAELALRVAPTTQAELWLQRLRLRGDARVVIAATLGRAVAGGVPSLIEWMSDDALARPAAAALHLVTGADIAEEGLARETAGADGGPTDDPLDERVALDPDDAVPWPDPAAVGAWWERRRGTFDSGRLLCGRPIGRESLEQVLRVGNQRARRIASLERTIARRRCMLFESRAPAWRQRRALGEVPETMERAS